MSLLLLAYRYQRVVSRQGGSTLLASLVLSFLFLGFVLIFILMNSSAAVTRAMKDGRFNPYTFAAGSLVNRMATVVVSSNGFVSTYCSTALGTAGNKICEILPNSASSNSIGRDFGLPFCDSDSTVGLGTILFPEKPGLQACIRSLSLAISDQNILQNVTVSARAGKLNKFSYIDAGFEVKFLGFPAFTYYPGLNSAAECPNTPVVTGTNNTSITGTINLLCQPPAYSCALSVPQVDDDIDRRDVNNPSNIPCVNSFSPPVVSYIPDKSKYELIQSTVALPRSPRILPDLREILLQTGSGCSAVSGSTSSIRCSNGSSVSRLKIIHLPSDVDISSSSGSSLQIDAGVAIIATCNKFALPSSKVGLVALGDASFILIGARIKPGTSDELQACPSPSGQTIDLGSNSSGQISVIAPGANIIIQGGNASAPVDGAFVGSSLKLLGNAEISSSKLLSTSNSSTSWVLAYLFKDFFSTSTGNIRQSLGSYTQWRVY